MVSGEWPLYCAVLACTALCRLRLLPFLLCTTTTLAYPPGFTQYLTDFPLEQADPAETRTLGALPVPGGLSARGTFYKVPHRTTMARR